MYFPDVMKRLFKKNPDFEDNAKWAIRYTAEAGLVNEEKTLEILSLVCYVNKIKIIWSSDLQISVFFFNVFLFQAQQELEMAPRDGNFQNPYRLENLLKQDLPSPSTTTTKKPRKKLQRGPRLAAGEL